MVGIYLLFSFLDEELTTNSVIEKKNSCNGENYDLVECVSINDMPTQIVVLEGNVEFQYNYQSAQY